ncbi:hypothetical protein CBL_10764 [Carabus blaptoides fortunei]
MRYGNAHLEQVNQTQLRNRYQSSKEKLQEFEVDVAHMVRLAHPTAPDCLASQTFIYGVRNSEIQQALRLARPKTLDDVLAYALDHEAAKQASRNQSQVRNIDAERNENTEILDERVRRINTANEDGSKKRRKGVRKLNRVDAKGQSSTRNPVAPQSISYDTSFHHQSNSIYVDGSIDGRPLKMLLDTGEIDGTITIGNTSIKHRALVAEIEDELMLGMDIMTRHGFKLDLEKGVKKFDKEEHVLNPRDDKAPKNDDVKTGIGVIGISLIKASHFIPVRIMNVKFYPIVLKRGTIIGECLAVSSIIRTIKAKENTSEEIQDKLINQISTSS